MNKFAIVNPGAVIGILGDGQLGKMIALAAAHVGYKVAVLGPGGRESPAGQVAYWAKAWEASGEVSESLLDEFCSRVAVVMIEWENIPVTLVERIEARGIPVRPGSKVLAVAQDRLLEKQCAETLGIPVPTYSNVEQGMLNPEDLGIVPHERILKTRRNGYDGKGQVRIPPGSSVEDAWQALKLVPCVLEHVVDFASEVSVIVARAPQTASDVKAEYVVLGPFENSHEEGILRATHYPIGSIRGHVMRSDAARLAIEATIKIAQHLDVHGLLAVEFFVTRDGEVLFNEMAPRPHNSGHLTIECCDTSQFEQYVRAACNLPWGSTYFHSRGVMYNILGDEVEKWMEFLPQQRLALHLYGKGEAKPGRKMGHVTYRVEHD